MISIYVIVGLIDSILCIDLFNHFFERRFKSFGYFVIGVFLFSVITTINIAVLDIVGSESVLLHYERILVQIFSGMTLCFIGFKGKKFDLVLLFVIFYICEIVAESAYMFVFSVLGISIKNPSPIQELGSCGMQKILTLIVSKIFQRVFSGEKRRIEGKLFISLILLPLVTIVFVVYLYRIDFPNPHDQLFVSIATPVLASLNLIVFAVVEKVSRLQYEHHEYDFLKQKVELEKEYYDHLDEIEQKQVSVRHDIKHYVSVLQAFLAEKKYDEMKNLLDQFEQGMNKITPMVYTNNRVLNALLSEKNNTAKRKGVTIDLNVEPNVDLSGVSDLDLISLFGNLIDNAIRAELESTVEKKKVTVRLFESDGKFNVLNVVNHFSRIEKSRVGFISTKKDDGQDHGIGLRNVEKISRKYNGVFNVDAEDNIFDVTVCLPARKN